MTLVGHDEVLTGGRGWLGRAGRIPAVELGMVTAKTEVWGLGARTFGLIHVKGGVADMSIGTSFGCGVLLEDSDDGEEDWMGVCDAVELRYDWGAVTETGEVTLAGDTAGFSWNVW